MHYHFQIHEEDKGYWAECKELDGCITQADDLEELKKNMHQALNLFLSEPENSQILFPLPDNSYENSKVENIEVEPKVALSFLLRRQRILSKLTQSEVAKRLGLKSIWSYQRLEKPSSANASVTTLSKLLQVFPDLELDMVFK
ncbi:MAG: type II toxin-antitoxin system HicB family antitoxin [Candidatus Cloacimonetes bacterium]|nr:type II toxin-antitoxin system HicB family antitoxin [Candidatus Cloacimonadota bacterium]MCF7814306.1 type II toxin-antitoxin system HicB family antitoxin [Candidatus Cloacimonadota bacterium]MCF7868383.1 type II toxin-antitoxin system HicB family antitoxin [Candidatus Cloacimonadota bacterium]MCF7883852.1 type II toxin-antitoxin system HicB family antitoxin [Candidatus Cloacimonadota bacterium]